MSSAREAMKANRPTPQVLYDSRYFDEELHRNHWFTNNAAKRARRWREIVQMLVPTGEDRILEIGCAAGEHSLKLAHIAGEVVGVDLAPAAIERARFRASQVHATNASFRVSDAANLSEWPEARFDKVAAIDFVEHVDDAALNAILIEVQRVLVPGGRLAIYTPCATHYVERMKARNFILRQLPVHIAVRAPDAYRTLLARAGFAVESLRFSPSDYPLFGFLDRLLSPVPGLGAWFHFRICIVAIKPDHPACRLWLR